MNRVIQSTPGLEAACEAVRGGGLLALDTEFVWNRTFWPRLGIVQFAGKDGACHVVDCLGGADPAALGALIADPSVVKILHDARQDLGHLRRYAGAPPRNVFDTRLAAGFAGFSSAIGLQSLLREALGVDLTKSETLTDWTRRPLTEAQIEYALDDVRHLAALRDDLLRRAGERGTRAWLEEELARYDAPSLYEEPDPDDAWKRIRPGPGRLGRAGFAVLRAVAAERERRARLWDLPRNWLGDDASLVALALRGAGKGAGGRLARHEVAFRHRLRDGARRDALAAAYAEAATAALALPEAAWPASPKSAYARETLDKADRAVAWLRRRAEAMRLDPAVVASRADVTAFLARPDDPSTPLASGWRLEAAGREMASLFA